MTTDAPKGWSHFAHTVAQMKYAHDLSGGGKETWEQVAHRVSWSVFGAVMERLPVGQRQRVAEMAAEVERLIAQRKFLPGGRYLYAAGRPLHQVQNCLLLVAEDSREGWADLGHKHFMGLMTGAGLGTVYSEVREEGAVISRTGGKATGPVSLAHIMNEIGRKVMQGGSRRSALWGGLHWWHPDATKWITAKNWAPEVRALKDKDFNFPAPLDMTNISNCLDDDFFAAYDRVEHTRHVLAKSTYWTTIRQMLKTGEPGFSVDVGANSGEWLRNACTEVSSADDSDICNLASINLARVVDVHEFKNILPLALAFMLAGTLYSDLPYDKVGVIREKNRRLGLGLMGVHEWLLRRGKKYGSDAELGSWLSHYAASTEIAGAIADEWGISRPVKTRAVAPTGTIGIVAETTTGMEPVFCVAYKRRYLKGNTHHYQYVIDPTAKRIIDEGGVHPDSIEDAYVLAEDVERRVSMQAWLQQYVDHAISSTINLPAWGTEENNEDRVVAFGDMLIKYLPRLRGITVYPDGSRGGQPLNPVKFSTAMRHVGKEFSETVVEEAADICDVTRGGSCGA
jgi:ribonucleoside-diphosphate reductase alpha chain